MEFNRISRSLVNISRNLILVKFDKITRLVESSKFFRRKVDINKNFRPINTSRFPRF